MQKCQRPMENWPLTGCSEPLAGQHGQGQPTWSHSQTYMDLESCSALMWGLVGTPRAIGLNRSCSEMRTQDTATSTMRSEACVQRQARPDSVTGMGCSFPRMPWGHLSSPCTQMPCWEGKSKRRNISGRELNSELPIYSNNTELTWKRLYYVEELGRL